MTGRGPLGSRFLAPTPGHRSWRAHAKPVRKQGVGISASRPLCALHSPVRDILGVVPMAFRGAKRWRGEAWSTGRD